jgi:hypothetical protein
VENVFDIVREIKIQKIWARDEDLKGRSLEEYIVRLWNYSPFTCESEQLTSDFRRRAAGRVLVVP